MMKNILFSAFVLSPIVFLLGKRRVHFSDCKGTLTENIEPTDEEYGTITGKISSNGKPVAFANIMLMGTRLGSTSDENGRYTISNIPARKYKIKVSYLGFKSKEKIITVKAGDILTLNFELAENVNMVDEVVVTGTLKEVKRLESTVPVEVYSPVFFKKNPTPNIYETLQNVNGVRPQLNCQVCNTGDIHINGLEGPYTMVLIDGMPIVSNLATVYGLSGIPNSLVERIEIVKGPASSLYGSEAIGGLINVITKNPNKAPTFTIDAMATTWEEYNLDLGTKFNLGKKASVLTGINYFNYENIVDNNNDNFTDVTLQERVSVFQKWNIKRKNNRLFTLGGRFLWEDRWGGELNWNKSFRGGNEVYGESIVTNRWEFIGNYQLPTSEKLLFSFSFSAHDQDSFYGDTSYDANQKTVFGQLTWDKKIGAHDLLFGSALRYRVYDDNTPATGGESFNPNNDPEETWLPGIFVQDEITINDQHKILLGARYDHHNEHGNIFTPRLAYKWSVTDTDILRLNTGTGFRVVNLFTEDHAALTGAREVITAEKLEPEQSYNVNLNYIKKIYMPQGGSIHFDVTAWYTYFTNAIFPDYETNVNQIIYNNLDGFAITKGISANVNLLPSNRFSASIGATLMDVSTEENGVKERQILTESFSGNWSISYKFLKNNQLSVDYTGSIYGPMKLPLLGEYDPRPEKSPTWSIQNIQMTYKINDIEIYGGVKNLLNWTPWKNLDEPIIARSFDPFDRNVKKDEDGNVIRTPDNPNALTFDPSYVYAPNQGIRGFLGVRYSFK